MTEDEKTQAFLAALTDLSVKYGIGINEGTAYIMEPEDMPYSYALDQESKIIRL